MLTTPRGPHPLLTGFLLGLLAAFVNPLTVGIAAVLILPDVSTETVTGDAMAPTFRDDELVIVDHDAREPDRGEVVYLEGVCDSQSVAEDDFLRVVGLPGETVRVVQGVVRVDGRPLEEPYARGAQPETYPAAALGPGEYYVLADNRLETEQLDSRLCGPVSAILGTLRDDTPPTWAGVTVALLLSVVFAVVAYVLARRRGRSGWWSVMGLWMWGAVVLVLWLMGRPRGPEPLDFSQDEPLV